MMSVEQNPRFKQLTHSRLLVYPKDPPKEQLGNFSDKAQLKKPPPCSVNNTILDSHMQDGHFQESTAGRIPSLHTSTGFINTETAAKAAERQAIDDDTLEQWNQSRQAVMELARRRKQLMTTPFVTEEPTQWETTNQREFKNLLPCIERDTMDFTFQDPQKRGKGTLKKEQETLTTTPRTSTGHAMQFRQREADMDFAALNDMNKTVQRSGVMVSRNGTTVRLDQDIAADRPKPGVVGGKMTTSSGATYGNFDREFYKDPALFPSLQVTKDEDEFIAAKMNAAATRNHGMYSTTNSDNFQDKTSMVDTSGPNFAKAHFFDKKAGTLQMPKRGHDPVLRPGNMQRTERTVDVVPDHFTTTSMKMNAHFRQFE
eukprot:TRINITY_DN96342_c0_g1_i1.p1 TRINITY_DN96342_c0_g1~~TRINITY_DN96342_c0_g1_i1.p1  ORF type:complete len:371 (+),score=46.29 TRINITY_DN96342_c0_g1_i1:37-1149(+)